MENPIKIDYLGVPLFLETTTGFLWVVPLPSNSHHQDHYFFSRGSQPKPSFATGILGGGTTQVFLRKGGGGPFKMVTMITHETYWQKTMLCIEKPKMYRFCMVLCDPWLKS